MSLSSGQNRAVANPREAVGHYRLKSGGTTPFPPLPSFSPPLARGHSDLAGARPPSPPPWLRAWVKIARTATKTANIAIRRTTPSLNLLLRTAINDTYSRNRKHDQFYHNSEYHCIIFNLLYCVNASERTSFSILSTKWRTGVLERGHSISSVHFITRSDWYVR
jgi:hypothetical protein